jgi:hypothetical protein
VPVNSQPRNFVLGIRRAEERQLGQEIVVRSEAAGAGLSVGQEGHAGAEEVIGEGTTVGVGSRLGSFSGGGAPSDHQHTHCLDSAVPSFGRAAGPPGLVCWPTWSRGSSSPVMARKNSIAENIAGEKHDAWSG